MMLVIDAFESCNIVYNNRKHEEKTRRLKHLKKFPEQVSSKDKAI